MSLQVVVGSSILAFLLAQVFSLPVKKDAYSGYSAPPTQVQGDQRFFYGGYNQPQGQPPAFSQQTGSVPVAQQGAALQTGPQGLHPQSGLSVQYVSPPLPPLPPPEPQYQGGELFHYKTLSERGQAESETEEQGLLLPPPMYESGPQGLHPQSGLSVQYVSPPLPPPEPQYQGGELFHYKTLAERGQAESETEEQGLLLPPPMSEPQQVVVSQPRSPPYFGPFYPPYTHMFLTGQIPRGTLSHFSATYEKGRDNWAEGHYLRVDDPPTPVLQVESTLQKKVFPSLSQK